MSRNMFGWSLPPGVTSKMIDDAMGGTDEPCEVCARPVDDCVCPECPVCHEIGRLKCYGQEGHGMRLSRAQAASRQEVRASALVVLEVLKESEELDQDQ